MRRTKWGFIGIYLYSSLDIFPMQTDVARLIVGIIMTCGAIVFVSLIAIIVRIRRNKNKHTPVISEIPFPEEGDK